MAIPESWIRASAKVRNTIGDTAARQVGVLIDRYLQTHPNATAKEVINFAQNTIEDALRLHGEMAAKIAADDFNTIMDEAGEDVSTKLYGYDDVIDDSAIRAQVEKSYHNNFERASINPEQFMRAMGNVASSDINRMHMMNIKLNARKNEIRYARVPTGSKTCAWCMMLAAKGAVYYSEDAAQKANHKNCDCIFVPLPEGEYAEGWDGKAQERMDETMKMARIDPNTNWKDITQEQWAKLDALVKQQKVSYYKNGIQGELLCDEKTLAFKTKGEERRKVFEIEKHSISKLYRFGIDAHFWKDEVKKGWKITGLPDLASGIEIKVGYKTNSYLAVADKIENSLKKSGLKLIYLDFSENKIAKKNDLELWLTEVLDTHTSVPVLVLFPNEDIPKMF